MRFLGRAWPLTQGCKVKIHSPGQSMPEIMASDVAPWPLRRLTSIALKPPEQMFTYDLVKTRQELTSGESKATRTQTPATALGRCETLTPSHGGKGDPRWRQSSVELPAWQRALHTIPANKTIRTMIMTTVMIQITEPAVMTMVPLKQVMPQSLRT